MRRSSYILLALGGVMTGVSGGATHAATSTSAFNMALSIQAECRLASISDMPFGTTGVIHDAQTQTATISVQCTSPTPYIISLDSGTGAGATTLVRRMTGSTGGTIDYSLYRDSAHTQPWGIMPNIDTLSATGSDDVQTHSIYGRVPPHATPAVGTYSDTVQVTITY